MMCETSSSIQERTYSGEEDTLALLDGVPGVRTTLRGQEESLKSSASGRRDNFGAFMVYFVVKFVVVMILVVLVSHSGSHSGSHS